MKFELKDFQTVAARSIIAKLAQARAGVENNELEAIVLSAPTGSGKTITVAAVIDWLLGGAEGVAARPNTVFLWLSDSPELNQQSKGKLIAACEQVPFHRLVTVESDTFDEEKLRPGHVYFINTQLLGKDKILTKGGDRKTYTFWQTVANTIEAAPEDFVLIIDEAHRGAGVTDRARKPIMQKFITGSSEDGLPAVPIVLGMSATPQRFTELLGNTTRTQRPVIISSEMVRQSGLLKDLILVTTNKSTTVESDITHLQQAAMRWKELSKKWEEYCVREKEKNIVRPVLVVQVQDGTESKLTSTPLDDVVTSIQRITGNLSPNEIVHCFQEKDDIQYGGCIIRKIEASRIQDSSDVKVVLFKTALTTGWDCPRAEVMMSFRRSVDATTIAQLVGRMIRTPLARRIESDEVLNTVELFLPHYDATSLDSVLAALRNPEAHDGTSTEVVTHAVEYKRNKKFDEVFKHLETLRTYGVNRAPRLSGTKRVLRLASMLVHEGLDLDADDEVRGRLVDELLRLRERYKAEVQGWTDLVSSTGEVGVDVISVSVGGMKVEGRRTKTLAMSDENIDQVFDEAGRLLAAGEGLHRTYWKRVSGEGDSRECKLELSAIVRQAGTVESLETIAKREFQRLFGQHKGEVNKLPAAERSRFSELVLASGNAVEIDWTLPDAIVEKPGKQTWEAHLYVDGKGAFNADLNDWEVSFLKWAQEKDDFVCWLRNLERRNWAFCVPYELAGEKAFYPDFVIVRKTRGGFVVDLLEPHDDTRLDTWAKVRGLAKFADTHGMSFGRLIVGRKEKDRLQIVDVSSHEVRERARRMGAPADLESLFLDC